MAVLITLKIAACESVTVDPGASSLRPRVLEYELRGGLKHEEQPVRGGVKTRRWALEAGVGDEEVG